MRSIEWIGYIAAFLNIISYCPQIIRIWKTKSVKDIALGSYIFLIMSNLLWIVYGFFLGGSALVMANCIALVFISCVLILKIRFDFVKK